MEKAGILNILRRGNTVFTFKDILLASGETNASLLKRRINYYVKNNELYPVRRGIYAKDRDYNRLELANKIFTPSYISFETMLAREGIVFQQYDQIFVASYLSRQVSCDGQIFVFRQIKNSVLFNSSGIEQRNGYYTAGKERAFLDTIYLNKNYHFDNLSPINWDECFKILPIYQNKAMAERLKLYYRLAKDA